MKLQIKSNPMKSTYTVKMLIQDLLQCENLDAPCYIFNLDTGDRFSLHSIDDTFDDHRFIDLNFSEE